METYLSANAECDVVLAWGTEMPKKALRREISIELLRSFLAVVDSRSFKSAAHGLNLSQPTISGHVARLQQLLGVALFDKSRPGVWLTPAGEVTVESAREILSIHDGLPGRISSQAGQPSATTEISVGCPDELRCWVLVPAFAEFQKRYPDVHFVVKRGTSEQLLNLVQTGKLTATAVPTRAKMASASRSWQQPLNWVGLPGKRFDKAGPISLAAPPDGLIKDVILEELARQKIPYAITFQGAHMDGAIVAAREGLGVTVVNGATAPAGLTRIADDMRLVQLPQVWWGVFVSGALNDLRAQELMDQLATMLETTIRALDPL
jgi:DNA-binding transcriptional LysR family regulator